AAIASAFAVAPAPAQDAAPTIADPMALPAEPMRLADHALVLDLARAGTRLVAVGERGQVLLSDDGQDWRQSTGVPVRSNLTAVSAVGASVWAVGHDGTILHSADAGETWQVQRRDPWAPATDDAAHDPRQGVPLLDVLFTDASTGYAVGAYSLLLTTRDGGQTWTGGRINVVGGGETLINGKPALINDASPVTVVDRAQVDDALPDDDSGDTFSAEELRIGEEADPHLNAIARTGSGAFVIVAERGAIFRSRDGGANWERSQLPYDGSMFGVIGYDGDHVLAFGLRGHVFESRDLGTSWVDVPTGTELSLMGGAALADGGAIVVGANGTVLHRAGASDPLVLSTHTAGGAIAGVLPLADGRELVVAGENGLSRYQPK
ncbi:MAG: hypothetical protein J0L88_13005, partial [Xanthomonadales bacterium]|nr:hypothetical protein [Xanthomonadales bacterium]